LKIESVCMIILLKWNKFKMNTLLLFERLYKDKIIITEWPSRVFQHQWNERFVFILSSPAHFLNFKTRDTDKITPWYVANSWLAWNEFISTWSCLRNLGSSGKKYRMSQLLLNDHACLIFTEIHSHQGY
jgi:hypothetical protein